MIRDYERVARQLESVINVLNSYSENNQAISIGKACRLANIHEAWLYRILNNIEDYKISEELLSRLEEARDGVISVILQRLDEIAFGDGESEFVNDSLECSENNSEANASDHSKPKDSGNRIARDTLKLKHLQWKYKCLLPKHFNEGASANALVVNGNVNQQYNINLSHLTPDQLRAIASIKITNENNNE